MVTEYNLQLKKKLQEMLKKKRGQMLPLLEL
jgi:hypothetical protein